MDKEYNFTDSTFWCFIKSFAWTTLNLIAGAAPFLTVEGIKASNLSKESNFISDHEITHLINDCSVMFVFSIIMIAVLIDYLFSKINLPKAITVTIISVAGITWLGVCSIYALKVFMENGKNIVFNINSIQKIVIIVSLFYCVLLKTILFKKEKTSKYLNHGTNS